MKKAYLVALSLLLVATVQARAGEFMQGKPDIKALGSLAFGDSGVLFVGDAQNAAIFAIDLGDATPNTSTEQLRVQDIDTKIADMLGTNARGIRINDLAVNPISQNAYLSVTRGRGNEASNVLLRVTPNGNIEAVSLEDVKYAKKDLSNPISAEIKDRRGRSKRAEAITDLAYADGKIYIAGLSNQEFASTLRLVSYPFEENETASSLEIYHAAHKKYETHSPIRTLMTYTLNNEPYVLAAYTCTPLVTFPVSQLTNGAHVKGKTVAEFGSGNTPLDMISYEADGKNYILLANSSRALMKVDPEKIEMQKEGLTEPVEERYGTAGVDFININQVGVQQLDNLNANHVLVLQRMGNGALNLQSLPKRRL